MLNALQRVPAAILGLLLLGTALLPHRASAQVTLTVRELMDKNFYLDISGHSGVWSYQASAGSGFCTDMTAQQNSIYISSLTPNTTVDISVYSGAGCSSEIASTSVTTPALRASNVAATTATLTLLPGSTGYTRLYYKQVSPVHGGCQSAAANSLSVDLTGLQQGQSYDYRAFPPNCTGNANGFATATFTMDNLPPAPSRVDLTAYHEAVVLNWISGGDGGSPISGWEYIKKVGTSAWETEYTSIPNSGANTTSHTITGLINGTTYRFKVRAVNALGSGASLTSGAATPVAAALWAENIDATSVVLSPRNLVEGAWSYEITGSGTSLGCISIPFIDRTMHTGLNPGTSYTAKFFDAWGCNSADRLADAPFTTKASGYQPPSLSVNSVTQSSATLHLSGHTGEWWYTDTSRSTCTRVPSGTSSVNIIGLQPNSPYDYEASGTEGCWNATQPTAWWTNVGFSTLGPISVSATKTQNSVTLTISGVSSGKWSYTYKKDGGYWAACTTHDATTTAATVTGLDRGTSYRFHVYHSTDGGCSFADRVATNVTTTNLTAQAIGTNSAQLALANYEGTWYHKQVSQTGGTCSSEVSGGTASIASLTEGTAYNWKAYGAAGCAETEEIGSTTFTTEESTALSVSDVTAESLTLDLSGHSDGWWYDGAVDGQQVISCTAVASGTATADLATLNPSTTYEFRAFDLAGCAASDLIAGPIEATTPATVPSAPSRPTVTAGDASVALQWTAGADGGSTVTQWQYAYKTDGDFGPWAPMAGSDGGTTTYKATGLENDTVYVFKVRAVNSVGNGAAAPESSPVTPRVDSAPSFGGISIASRDYTQATAIEAVTLPEATGGNGHLVYALTPDLPDGLSFDAAARSVSGTPSVGQEATQYTYAATDEDDDKATLVFSITIAEDLAPSFDGASIEDRDYLQATAIDGVTLPEATGGNGDLDYSVTPGLPDGLRFDAVARSLSGTPTVEQAATQYTYAATDEDDDKATLVFSITVAADLVPSFDGASIENMVYTEALATSAVALPEATGGNGDLAYALTPDLPDGLRFDAAARTLSGTPTVAQEATQYTYAATDTDDDEATLEFSVTVAADLVPSFDGASIPDKSYAQTMAIEAVMLPEAIGGDGDLRYTLTPNLPDGLSFDASTCSIAGTPTAAQEETQYTYKATDEDGDQAALSFAISVAEDLVPSFDGDGIADLQFKQHAAIQGETLPAATGGNGDLRYTLAPGLPDGLHFDAAARMISGTPNVAMEATPYTYTATDADGDHKSLAFALAVKANRVPGFGGVTIASQRFLQDSEIQTEILPVATGGDGDLHYTLTPDLPDGLYLNTSTRELAGTPTVAQPLTQYVYAATDDDGDRVTLTFGITVAEDRVPSFEHGAVADLHLRQNETIATVVLPGATGGDGDLHYALTPDLPDGLHFDTAARTLSGMPDVALQATRYSYFVTDEDGDQVSIEFSITVIPDLVPSFDGSTLADFHFRQNDAIAAVALPAATSGDGDLHYSLMPALPAGLRFDAAARTLSGTPSVALETTQYSYVATDEDGDAGSLAFAITVQSDLAPSFGDARVGDFQFKQHVPLAGTTLPAATGGNGSLSYALTPDLPDGLQFDAVERRITGTPSVALDETQYSYEAVDEDGDQAGLSFSIVIAANLLPSFEGASIEGLRFRQHSEIATVMLPAAAGGNGFLGYTLTPDLPEGLLFDAGARSLTGTPTVAQGETQYTYTATDSDGDQVSLPFALTVAPDLVPSFDGVTIGRMEFVQNRAIETITFPTASGGDGALSYTLAPELPAGLVFAAGSRTVSGTPTVSQEETQYTYTATDEDGDHVALQFALAVAPDLMPSFESVGIEARIYTQNLAIETTVLPQASGGDGAVSYSLAPDLPDGLVFDANARTLSGTPTVSQQETEYTYTATDEDGDQADLRFSMTVVPDLMPTFDDAIIESQHFTQNLAIEAVTFPEVSGGDGEPAYMLAPDLPSGLAFDADTRLLSGTPTEAKATTRYTYSATDNDGDQVELMFTMTVAPDLTPVFGVQRIADLQLRRGHRMAPVTLPAATSGDGELRYELAPALPEGLSFDAERRVLSGVPANVSALQEYRYTVIDSDAQAADRASLSFAIEIMIAAEDKMVLSDALAAQGRALLTGATTVIGDRFRTPLGEKGDPGGEASVLQSVSRWLSGVAPAGTAAETGGFGMEMHRRATKVRLNDLMTGQNLRLSFSGALDGHGSVRPRRWTLWSAADVQAYNGSTERNEYDGSVASVFLGGDVRFAGEWVAGAAFSRSAGLTNYSVERRSGKLETHINAVYPYVRGYVGSGWEVWAIGGFGTGDAEDMSGHEGAQMESGSLTLRMTSAGLRRPLLHKGKLGMSLVGAAGWLALGTENGASAVHGLDVGVTQARLALEVSGTVAAMAPYLRLGARGDGGDGQTGAGLEMVGGLQYNRARVAFELQGRWLAVHSSSDYQEFGGMARLTLQARPDGTGFQASLKPAWGSTHAALLSGESMLGLPAQSIAAPARGALADGAMTLETDLGYGVAVLPEHRIKVGAHVQHFGGSMREGVGLTWESAAPKGDQGVIPGLKVRIEYERPTSFMAGGAGIAVNYGIRF